MILDYSLDTLSKVLPPIVGVLIGFFLSEWKGRKSIYEQKRNKSLLGVAILEYLIEEVKVGFDILIQAKNDRKIGNLLPSKTWSGVQTVNDDVLLRIIAVSKAEKSRGLFHPKDLRTHCKNYFEFVVGNFNKALLERRSLEPFFDGPGDKYDKAAKGVLDMLQQAKELLEQDAVSRKPKG